MSINEVRIAPEPLFRLDDGRAIYTTLTGGMMQGGRSRDGAPIVSHYNEGALVLVRHGRIIVGPIEMRAALGLAENVCKLDPIALTGSQHIHILATALLGLMACMPPLDPQPATTVATPQPEVA